MINYILLYFFLYFTYNTNVFRYQIKKQKQQKTCIGTLWLRLLHTSLKRLGPPLLIVYWDGKNHCPQQQQQLPALTTGCSDFFFQTFFPQSSLAYAGIPWRTSPPRYQIPNILMAVAGLRDKMSAGLGVLLQTDPACLRGALWPYCVS